MVGSFRIKPVSVNECILRRHSKDSWFGIPLLRQRCYSAYLDNCWPNREQCIRNISVLVNACGSCDGIDKIISKDFNLKISGTVWITTFTRIEAELPEEFQRRVTGMMGFFCISIKDFQRRYDKPTM